jgi:hypothetical protein
MKLYVITAQDKQTQNWVFAVTIPSSSGGFICFELNWESIEYTSKYGFFSFMIVVTEDEKKTIEAFWSGNQFSEPIVKGNNIDEWNEFKNNQEYQSIEFKEIQTLNL